MCAVPAVNANAEIPAPNEGAQVKPSQPAPNRAEAKRTEADQNTAVRAAVETEMKPTAEPSAVEVAEPEDKPAVRSCGPDSSA